MAVSFDTIPLDKTPVTLRFLVPGVVDVDVSRGLSGFEESVSLSVLSVTRVLSSIDFTSDSTLFFICSVFPSGKT